MSGSRLLVRLADILTAIARIERYIDGFTAERFREDDLVQSAVERQLEKISEATRHIPHELVQRHSEVPWQKVKAAGNVLRHDYQRVDVDIIWQTAREGLAPIRQAVAAMHSELQPSENDMPQNTRIDRRFAALKADGRAALVTFFTAGDPDYDTALAIIRGLPKAGADVIEIGMPFSDPMADGPAIQASALRALKAGQTLQKTLDLVAAFRQTDSDTPIVLMGYYNPIYSFGPERFLDAAKAAGVDGLIVVDLPPEADDEVCLPARARGINFIRLATPTTDAARLPAVLNNTSGFLYYVSIAGITGAAAPDPTAVAGQVAAIRKHTKLPIAVGFGVRTPAQAQGIAGFADGVVVGSALVTALADTLAADGTAGKRSVAAVHELVQSLSAAVRSR